MISAITQRPIINNNKWYWQWSNCNSLLKSDLKCTQIPDDCSIFIYCEDCQFKKSLNIWNKKLCLLLGYIGIHKCTKIRSGNKSSVRWSNVCRRDFKTANKMRLMKRHSFRGQKGHSQIVIPTVMSNSNINNALIRHMICCKTQWRFSKYRRIIYAPGST